MSNRHQARRMLLRLTTAPDVGRALRTLGLAAALASVAVACVTLPARAADAAPDLAAPGQIERAG